MYIELRMKYLTSGTFSNYIVDYNNCILKCSVTLTNCFISNKATQYFLSNKNIVRRTGVEYDLITWL